MTNLAELLLHYGMIQFGQFAVADGSVTPVGIRLDLLASYPVALRAAAEEIQNGIDQHIKAFERLLCPSHSVPLATLVSARTGIPLVYSRGRGEPAVDDLIGAYDINHPTLFLTNAYVPWENHSHLISSANRVGLKVTDAFAILNVGRPTGFGETNLNWAAIYSLKEITTLAREQHYISERMRNRIDRWHLSED